MEIAANVLVGVVAALHAAFLVLEMFLWTGPRGGRKILGMTQEQADASAPLAKNQGLYNGFLAAGMAYMLSGQAGSHAIGVFCLGCAIVAGLFGALTVKPLFLLVQAFPAAAALGCVWLAGGGG
jgi:putative membrane protein